MKLLMTGAGGYVGGAALRAAVAAGHAVTAVLREGARRPAGVADAVVADLADTDRLARLASDADAVLHCAASEDPAFLPVGRAAGLALIGGLRAGGRFAAHGGSLVFGDTGPEARLPEGFAPPPPLAGRADMDAALLSAGNGVRCNVVYGSLVYGGGPGAMIPSVLLKAARAQGAALYVPDGGQVWSSCSVEAFGALLVAVVAAERGPAGPVFAAGPAWTLRDVASAVGRVLGVPMRPASNEEAASAFGPFGGALALNQHFSPRPAEAFGWQPPQDGLEGALAALAREQS